MRTDQKISAYNRINGMLSVTDELIRLYKPEPEVLGDLLTAYASLKMAQTNLGWDPGQK